MGTVKRPYVWLPVAAAAVFIFIFFQDFLAHLAWQKYRLPAIASVLNRGNAGLELELGNYYFNVSGLGAYDLKKAERHFNRALDIDPDIPDAWHQLARIDFLRGHFAEALVKINKQISIHGDSFTASYYMRGRVSGYAGDFKQAEADFKKFLVWDKTNWAAHNDLAWVYFKQGDYKKVEAIAREGLAYNKNNPWLLTSLGASLLNQGKRSEAKKIFENAQTAASALTEKDWNKAYPGNDPRIASKGLETMKKTIEYNLELSKK
mgnify:CR=1 FL=1